MLNYKVNDKNYIADEGYMFKHKKTEYLCRRFRKTSFNSINDYEIIEAPIEETKEPEEEYTLEERVSQVETDQIITNDRIEFVEDCLIEMSETVYGG